MIGLLERIVRFRVVFIIDVHRSKQFFPADIFTFEADQQCYAFFGRVLLLFDPYVF